MRQSLKNFPRLKRVLFTGAIATTAVWSWATPINGSSVVVAFQDSPKTIVDEVWQTVNREYVDNTFNQVDWQATRHELLSRSYASKEEAYKAIRKALETLEDPYTRFLVPEQFQALTNQTVGELSGVGIRMEIEKQTETPLIIEPIENSPAFKGGLQAGDRILAVDSKPTKGLSLEDASELIRGKVGSSVNLRIARPGQGIFEIELTRAQIEIPSVRYSVKEEGNLRVGYISLNEFSSHAAEQMQRAISNLNQQKVNAYVLDLRGNPGGLLFSSIEIARMWMQEGEIVSTIDRIGGKQAYTANRTALTQLPLAILVDGNSASASEILTGALKDNKRATVIGSRTFGKAAVQSVHSLSDGSGLTVTVSRYYLPSGEDISLKGIVPDIRQELTLEQRKLLSSQPGWRGTSKDPQYGKAIAVLKSTTASEPGNLSQPINSGRVW
ncbi:MAG: PDZ domain-containing protein [Moorea sp. SIO3C2]|nr:PDZ domain-containing protein [Moorena sp. SIO3C2]